MKIRDLALHLHTESKSYFEYPSVELASCDLYMLKLQTDDLISQVVTYLFLKEIYRPR